jgi:hypothetical protein
MIHQYWQQMLMVSLGLLKVDFDPPFFNFGPEYIEHNFRFTEFLTSVKAGKFYYSWLQKKREMKFDLM